MEWALQIGYDIYGLDEAFLARLFTHNVISLLKKFNHSTKQHVEH